MDISSIQAMANQYTSESSSTKKLQNSLKNDYSEATSEELMDVCKEFEAYFVEQIFKEMRKTIPESESTSSYSSTMKEYYEDSLYQEYAKAITQHTIFFHCHKNRGILFLQHIQNLGSAVFLGIASEQIRSALMVDFANLPQQFDNAGYILRFCKANFHRYPSVKIVSAPSAYFV